MTRQILSVFGKVTLLAALLAGTCLPLNAAVPAPTPKNADRQAQFEKDALMAQDSLWRKTQVGKIRYQKKLAEKASMVAGLRAELERKKATIVLPATPSQGEEAAAEQAASGVLSTLLWGIFIIIALLLFRHYWRRAAAKETPKPFETIKATSQTTRQTRPAARPAVKPAIAKTNSLPSRPQPLSAGLGSSPLRSVR